MTLLSQVKKGKISKPVLVLIYGVDGVGKSTFGAEAPNPVFLGTEKGTSNLDVSRLPAPTNFAQVLQAIDELIKEKHDFKTLVIDSLDWLEPLVWEQVCTNSGVKSIEDVGGGYGKGYVAANSLWREMIRKLTELQDTRHMNVILIAHSHVKTFQDPATQSGYDRYQLKLNDKAAAIFREYVDAVLFTNFEVATKKDKDKTRAFGDGARVIYTEKRPGFDAKNRYGLEKTEMSLDWDVFMDAIRTATSPGDVDLIKQSIVELIKGVKDPKVLDSVNSKLGDPTTSKATLMKIQNRLQQITA